MKKFNRKLRKFFRDPRLFWKDANVFGSSHHSEIISIEVKADSIKNESKIEKCLTPVQSIHRTSTIPWVVKSEEGKLKFKSIKPQKPEICSLITLDSEDDIENKIADVLSNNALSGSIFTVYGDYKESRLTDIISAYKPFTSDWFDVVKSTISINSKESIIDVISQSKYNIIRINIITDNSNLMARYDCYKYDYTISLVDLPQSFTKLCGKLDYIKSLREIDTLILDYLLQKSYKSGSESQLISLFDNSTIDNVNGCDVVLKLQKDNKVFKTFDEYISMICDDDVLLNVYASEDIIHSYSEFIITDNLKSFIRNSLINGAKYEII